MRIAEHNTPTIDNEAISQQLEALLTPAIFAQQKYYKQLGCRDRILNLFLCPLYWHISSVSSQSQRLVVSNSQRAFEQKDSPGTELL
jgi:hypothetical protein